jgi:hypothetical protein
MLKDRLEEGGQSNGESALPLRRLICFLRCTLPKPTSQNFAFDSLTLCVVDLRTGVLAAFG